MELDAKRFSEGTALDTDLCIVGAGPAGFVLAAEFVGRQCDVIVLESGGDRPEAGILALNVGDVTGDVYAGLGATRHRQLGGTSCLWNTEIGGTAGAKYAPLDAADFDERSGFEHGGWPFGIGELREHYDRAQRICALGPFAYDAPAWSATGREPWSALGPDLVSRVYQLGARDAFIAPLRASIAGATNIRLCSHATVTGLHADAAGRRMTHASIATPGAAKWSVRAKRFVLAAGAVENARLLLISGESAHGLGNASGWVGRGFMEHPRDRALSLRPRSPDLYRSAGFYDLRHAADGTWIVGRLALSDAALATGQLPNASATLLPRMRAATDKLRAVLPAFAARSLPSGGHGWSRQHAAARAFDGFTVLLNVEQSPHPENRVTLSARRDSLGVPLPALEWRWRADDHQRLERLRAVVARELDAAGLGQITVDAKAIPDPNAHHHAGTTRMHVDPRRGVTDSDGRVHATENVYVAGASTFPTAGFANPVLTIVALTLRLAAHLTRSS
ncbi:MAG: GMC family oxidoreductase [Gemmatimonadota bacterium]|nr:GMC family oxidoreductase [Gemmatimonadota bacterium]